jgi:TonB family protein
VKNSSIGPWILVALLAAGLCSPGPFVEAKAEQATPFAYHLRVVRVSGAAEIPGAALGWAEDDGKPVVLPDYEAWGSAEQLEALAATLGGKRADAVTGFFLTAGHEGVRSFSRPVYIGEAVLDLQFRAESPASAEQGHRISLELAATEPRFEPLTEAELLLRTEQTVAVACPALTEDDWLVVAVTLIEQRAVTEQGEALGKLHDTKDPGVTKPRIVNKVEPAYPEAARKNQVSGHVVLELVLDRDGIPRAPTVASMSPGCEELAAAAVEAVLQWRYEPAMLHGRPVPVLFTVTVQFKLA